MRAIQLVVPAVFVGVFAMFACSHNDTQSTTPGTSAADGGLWKDEAGTTKPVGEGTWSMGDAASFTEVPTVNARAIGGTGDAGVGIDPSEAEKLGTSLTDPSHRRL